ncbi:MAG: aminodeoxychorismate lyase [Rhodospirillaceae bacterium]|nr:aminodeoxychorismate lyase [Rhodospirillaceae bacterium]
MRRFAVRCLVAAFAAAILAVGGGILWAWNGYRAPGPLEEATTLVVPKGAGVKEIANLLRDAGVIDNAHLFILGAQYKKLARKMRAGEFAFASHISMRDAAANLVSSETVKRRLTVPEGLLTAEVIALVEKADGLVGDVPYGLPDGIYLPETYFFNYGDTRATVLTRMRTNMEKTLKEVWAARGQEIAVKTPEEALILASIIEKETGVSAERARVSGVFHNRLQRKMRLQSDPTVAYAVTDGGRPLGRPLTRADLYIASPYNTYTNWGLPPGPITNPGRASLEAAVNPTNSRELYFVADGTGGHAFARTLREHNRNVAKWRRLQRSQKP